LLRIVRRQSEFAFFGALTAVDAPFYFIFHLEEQKMKKLLALVMAVLLLLSLVACNNTPSNNDNNSESNQESGDTGGDTTDPSDSGNNDDNGNGNIDQICTAHNYVDNICATCGCSLWTGEVDTTWYSVINTEFTITTAEQFAGLVSIVNNGSNFENVKITLANHLDMNGQAISPIGATESTAFVGDFNGNDYIIENVTINANSIIKTGIDIYGEMYYSACAGLFGYCQGKLSNVNLKKLNIAIEVRDINNLDVGGLVVYSDGNVTNCSVEGNISVKTNKQFTVGGLVAISSAEVSHCSSSVVIDTELNCTDDVNPNIGGLIAYKRGDTVSESFSNGSVTFKLVGDEVELNTMYAGGLIGYTYEADVVNCYSTATVSATAERNNLCNTGGLIGRMEKGIVDSCFATGDVNLTCKEKGFAGGLIGYVNTGYFSSVLSTIKVKNCFATGTVYCDTDSDFSNGSASTIGTDAEEVLENCYYLNSLNITGDEIIKNGTPASMDDLKNIAFYENRMPWDTEVWVLVDGQYPTLK